VWYDLLDGKVFRVVAFLLVQRCSGDSAAGDTVKALFKFLSVAFVVLKLLALLFGGGTTIIDWS
jgi:hypothetical protein